MDSRGVLVLLPPTVTPKPRSRTLSRAHWASCRNRTSYDQLLSNTGFEATVHPLLLRRPLFPLADP